MKSLRTISLMALVAIVFASVAQAAPTVSIRIGDGSWDNAQVRPNAFTDLYISLSGVDASINAVEYKVNLPQNMAVIVNSFAFPGAIDFGSSATGSAIGFGECVPLYQVSQGHDDLVVHTMTVYAIGTFDPSPITLTAFEGGTDSPATPRYSTCNGQAMALSSSGAIIESTTGVPNDGSTWGAIKSLY